jgi:hypothetical protein
LLDEGGWPDHRACRNRRIVADAFAERDYLRDRTAGTRRYKRASRLQARSTPLSTCK